jgi:Rho-binding antiterminator
MTDAYTPIPCALYSEYELAILRRQRLRLRWRDGNIIYERVLRPVDLETKAHQEFLVACEEKNGQIWRIRLDHILKKDPV